MNGANGRARWFFVVVATQVALLLGWAGWHEWHRGHAPTILLETVPVDPRDVLRGDYLTLGYKISSVPAPADSGASAAGAAGEVGRSGGERAVGREIWVILRRSGRFYEVAATAWRAPDEDERDAERVVVRGHTAWSPDRQHLRVVYGIEKFFVPEGKGNLRFKEMVVEATVSADGQLGIKRLLVDGKAWP